MKEIINVKKVLLFTIIFILGITNICFADVYSPVTDFTRHFGGIFIIIEAILFITFIIALTCMIIGKILKSDNLYKKSAKVAGNAIFYFLLVFLIMLGCIIIVNNWGYDVVATIFGGIFILSAIFSLYFRIKKKNQKISFLILLSLILVGTIVFFIKYW